MSRQILTKAKTSLSAGIVGLANVGKSTFFQGLCRTDLGVPGNYPFATIDPEYAKVVVPTERLEKLKGLYHSKVAIPSTLEIVDIAGLVRGAAEGNGLGNSFLSNIRSVDGIYQMVRAFDDNEVIHVDKTVDPVRDLQTIHDELVLKDMEFVQSAIDTNSKKLKSQHGAASKDVVDLLKTAEEALKLLDVGANVASKTDWTDTQIKHLRTLSLLTAKPNVFVANVSEEDYCFTDISTNPYFKEITEWVSEHSPGETVVPVSVPLESRLAKMDPKEALAEMKELGVTSTLPECVTRMRFALGLHSYFTAGPIEVREWTIRQGALAPEAAGAIHTDLEKTFIACQVIKLSDAIAVNGDEAALKRAGKLQRKGKDYIVEDGDIMLFMSGASKPKAH